MNEANEKICRHFGAVLKQQILAQCAEPDASVASITLSRCINSNG